MTADQAPDNGHAPHRRHRRVEPWVDRETGEPAALWLRERAVQARYAPVRALVAALAADASFLGAVDDVRAERESADNVARRYVRRNGRPRRVMRRVIERAADSPLENPQLRVYGVAASATIKSEPLKPDDPREWTHAKRLPAAAAMVTRLGAGQCIVCGTSLATDGARRRYCGTHQASAALRERADREAVLSLLNGVADALEVG